MRLRTSVVMAGMVLLATSFVAAQQQRPMSPRGKAATQVAGKWVQEKPDAPPRYQDGKWIEVDYGRPILRGREDIFGSGAEYGQGVNAGAPVWRVGANKSTRFSTEVPLEFAGKRLAPGEYSMFVDLKDGNWTFILSSHEAQETFNREEKVAIWGAYGYDPAKDVLRAPMTTATLPFSVDELTITFVDMTQEGGKLAVMWDDTVATVPFKVVS